LHTPLGKRAVGRQRKNRIKGCFEGGSGQKPTDNETEKGKSLIRGKFKCKNRGELGHRMASFKCPLNGTKKRQVQIVLILPFLVQMLNFYVCRKRAPRANRTKGWFPSNTNTAGPSNTNTDVPSITDLGASSPPSSPKSPIPKKVVVRKITPRKKLG